MKPCFLLIRQLFITERLVRVRRLDLVSTLGGGRDRRFGLTVTPPQARQYASARTHGFNGPPLPVQLVDLFAVVAHNIDRTGGVATSDEVIRAIRASTGDMSKSIASGTPTARITPPTGE
jgi:hypothetical protein